MSCNGCEKKTCGYYSQIYNRAKEVCPIAFESLVYDYFAPFVNTGKLLYVTTKFPQTNKLDIGTKLKLVRVRENGQDILPISFFVDDIVGKHIILQSQEYPKGELLQKIKQNWGNQPGYLVPV